MNGNNIQMTVAKILEKRSGINFIEHPELQDKKILGSQIGMPARELLHIYFDIEHEFEIKISERDIVSGNFDTLNHIIEIVKNELMI